LTSLKQSHNDVVSKGLTPRWITNIRYAAAGDSEPKLDRFSWRCGQGTAGALAQVPQCLSLDHSVNGIGNPLDQCVSRITSDVDKAIIGFVVAYRSPGIEELALELADDLRGLGDIDGIAQPD
jgi:hypothetical protein